MKRINRNAVLACILSFVMAFLSCYVPEAFAGQSSSNTNKTSNFQPVDVNKDTGNHKKQIIIKYKTVTKRNKAVNSIVADNNLDQMARVDTVKEQKISIYEIGKKDNLNKVVDDLNDDPNIEYAQPNYPLTVAATPTDQKFDYQWSLENRGQQVKGFPGRENVDIDVEEAWNTTMGSKEVVIGVLDTGIDITHKDLKENIYTNKDEIPGNNKDDDGNGYIDDVHGWDFANDSSDVYASAKKDTHGTYVAGVIAASANDGGIVGIAPKVKLLPLKFISGSTGYTSDALEAIEYAKSMGIKIINCSFGGTDNNPALEDAMKNSGILFVCAAGNRGADTAEKPVYPAAFPIPNILSAASIDSKGIMPKFSSYGKLKADNTTTDEAAPDVAAPGTNILSTVPDNKYDYYSGTSVSAAMVSGVAALILSNLPKFTASDIKDRIMNTVVKCTALTNKVATEGRLNAGAALTLNVPAKDTYEGKGNDDDTPVEGDGEADTWYTLDERARNVERFHYGEGGINPASGNYSVTCTDMTIPAPGFQIEISRTYNSRNQRQTMLGRGWTFGFEGKVTYFDDETVEVSLPDGSSHVFHLENGTYIGEGTRASFVKDKDKVDILTTKDQYKYGFSTDTHKLLYMEDKNGNRISLSYDSKTENLTKITDTVGRVYTLSYNTKNLLESVTDPAVREVKYEYDTKTNLLTKVIDPQGDALEYDYDKDQYLTTQSTVKNNKTCTFQKLVYNHSIEGSQNKVVESTDADGETWYYSYDLKDMKTIITNKKDREWTYWFDSSMSTIQVLDPEKRSTYTEYAFQDEKTYYGDIKSSTDRNGNITKYYYKKHETDVNDNKGNVKKVINPDNGGHIYEYDQWNNVIEDSECEFTDIENWTVKRRTFYKYDSTGSKLLLKFQPINGTDGYVDSPTSDQYAITRYEYYTKDEAKQKFRYAINGLLKTETDPEGTVTTYSYNGFGDTTEVAKEGLDSNNKEITKTYSYSYNNIGQKVYQKTPESETTNWNYDKNGQVIREIHNDTGIKRIVYDDAGEKVREINPEQYEESKDDKNTGKYTGTNGTSYEWDDKGNLISTSSVRKYGDEDTTYTTKYTYDSFGNKTTETMPKPNGSIYRYEYDSLDRLTKTYFKAEESSSEVLLNETSYGILSNGNTWTKVTSYADDNTKSSITTFKDYADREVEVQYDDGTNIQTKYNPDGTVKEKKAANNAVTYYSYDGLGNLSTVLTPITDSDGKTMYSWMKYTYNKTGQVTEERRGKKLVTLEETKTGDYQNEDYYLKTSMYNKGLLTSVTDTDENKTDYSYDGDGRIVRKTDWVSPTEKQVTETQYNYLDKPVSVTKKVRTGDIIGNDYDNNNSTDLVEKYNYDKNGNILSYKDAADNYTSFTYDSQDQIRTTSSQLKDAEGNFVKNVETSKTYTWDGQTASEKDGMNNTTTYEYDKMGNQTQIIDAHNKVTWKAYDRMGRNTAIVSPKNYKSGTQLEDLEHTEFVYDSMGRVAQQKEIYKKMTRDVGFNWSGSTVNVTAKSYKYDALGNITETTDAIGDTSVTKYNLAGMPEYVTDGEKNSIRYVYNGLGQKVKEIYPDTTYEYSYDGAGNQTSQSIDGVEKSRTLYDGLGRAIKLTDGKNNTTTQIWNAFGKVAKVITPEDSTIPSNTATYQYDIRGNLALTKDSMHVVTTYTYDSLGRNLSRKISDTSGKEKIETSTTYDLNGNVLSEKDGRGNATSYTYDELNRKITSTNAKQQTTTYDYDENGNQTKETDYLGNTTQKVYDGINRMIEVSKGEKSDKIINQQLLYNDADAQSNSFDALGNETKFTYDHNLRQTGTIDGNGHSTSMTYDVRGNMTSKSDGRKDTTFYTYDGGNNLTSVTNALNEVTSYTYDPNGNVLTQTDGNGNVTTYMYNAANKLKMKTDPSDNGKAGLSESYTYYADGQMESKKDRNGITTGYTYDIVGRLTEENAGGEKQSYTYDDNGNMLTMTDASGTTARTYDELNRNTAKTVPGIGTSTYRYDIKTDTPGEYKEETTDPKGNVTERTYDKEGRLSKVTAGNETTGYEYYKNGRQYRVIYPNNSTETYSYDADNQVTTLINKKSDGSVLSSYEYTYDEAGNQTSKTDAKGKTIYEYDELNRLSRVTEPYVKDTTATQKITDYEYDGAGNRTSETVRIIPGDEYNTTLYSYNALNRLTKSASSSGEETCYTYDNNGNLISKSTGTSIIATLNDSTKTGTEDSTAGDLPSFDLIIRKDTDNGTGTKNLIKYNYDNFNRLKTMKDEDTTAAYTYNAQGYRVEKTINGKTTDYLYEGDKVVLETDKNNNQKAVQVYGNNLLSRSVSGNNEAGAEKYYYLYNAHGDVTSLINPTGGVAASYDYDAFGNITNKTGDADNSVLYAGYQHDDESGLYYLNARYYDSVTARFITEDTYTGEANDPLSLNLYTYCSNNPIIYNDPTGHAKATVYKNGSSGAQVVYIQKVLQSQGYDVDVDGNYGPQTAAAVRQYQKNNGLKVDGKVGTQTFSGINSYAKATGIGTSDLNNYIINNPKYGNKKAQLQKQKAENEKKTTSATSKNSTSKPTNQFNSKENKKTSKGTDNTNKTGYVIKTQSKNLVDIPDPPIINPKLGFILGFDKYSGGMIKGGLNLINKYTDNPIITQDTIDYNKECTYGFKDDYMAGEAVMGYCILATFGAVKNFEGASKAEGCSQADVLAKNRAQGKAFEQQEFSNFSSNYTNAAEQITIKTSSGTKTRVDAIGIDANGNVVINEFKSSATAPLTPNQKIAFPELYSGGGTVVGKGKGIFTGGYQIPSGTEVKIIRPQMK